MCICSCLSDRTGSLTNEDNLIAEQQLLVDTPVEAMIRIAPAMPTQEGTMVHLRPSWSATEAAGMMPIRLTTAMPANSRPAAAQKQDEPHLQTQGRQFDMFTLELGSAKRSPASANHVLQRIQQQSTSSKAPRPAAPGSQSVGPRT